MLEDAVHNPIVCVTNSEEPVLDLSEEATLHQAVPETHNEAVLILSARIVGENIEFVHTRWNRNPTECIQDERNTCVATPGQIRRPNISENVVFIPVENPDNCYVQLQLLKVSQYLALLSCARDFGFCLVH
jgi:hypothetical protein